MSDLYRKTTLKELGQNLPILPNINNEKDKFEKDQSFSFLEWDMGVEEEFAKIQKENISQGGLVNKILCRLLDTYCGRDFQSLSNNEKTIIINQAPFANVMYMYISLRVEELSNELNLNVICPYCKHEIKDFNADLETLEVRCKDKEHQRENEYTLKKPLLIDGKVITGFKYNVCNWDFIEGIKVNKNIVQTTMTKRMFYSAITNFLDSKGVIETFIDKKSVIDKIKKADIDKFLNAISENNAGPSMSVEIECPQCSNTSNRIIEWTYNNFFGISSL